MAQTLTVTKDDRKLEMHIQGGTVVTRFDAVKPFGGGELRARYFLNKADCYVFSKTTRAAANKPLEAVLAREDITDNPHVKELRIQKVAGGQRLLKLDIQFVVEEMEGRRVVGTGGPPQTFTALIEGRVAQLLDQTGDTHNEFAKTLDGVSPSQVGKMKRGGSVSAEAVAQLPRSIEEHMSAQKEAPARPKLRLKPKKKK